MKGLPLARLIDTRGWIVFGITTEVADMPQQMPFAVLGTRVAQMQANAEKGSGRFAHRPILHGQAAHQCKAAPVDEIFTQTHQTCRQTRQRKLRRAQGGNIDAASHQRRHGGRHLGNVVGTQFENPLGAVLHLAAIPD